MNDPITYKMTTSLSDDPFQNRIFARPYSTDSSAGPKLLLDLPLSFHVLKGFPALMTIVSKK